jgi:formate hydrogenlyase transcriptional activator
MGTSVQFRVIDRNRGGRKFEQIIGQSSALKTVLENVERVAPADASVLIQGETGTGKELIARAIHNLSTRCGRAFVSLNCAAIPSDLLESEIFGHEKGAFTGAIAQRIGRFEMADKGTVFLDEVGDLPLALQPKLLRVLQEQEFERLGSSRTHKADVRVVAATHRDLKDMVKQNTFRMDLYYRLNVFPILLPPLRARRDDIPGLATHFVEVYCRRMGKQIAHIPPETISAMRFYDWPGNIRELQNFIERSVILTSGNTLESPLADISRASGASWEVAASTESAANTSTRGRLRQSGWVAPVPVEAVTDLQEKKSPLYFTAKPGF